ncbi:MAG: alpha/beta hydrolase [Actinomycetota bacterium]
MPHVIAADGTRINYDVFGREDGEPLVLLMGLAVDRWGWVRQRAGLARRFRCIAIDNRGAGLSGKPHGAYDLFTMTSDVVAVMDAEGVESAHVMGYSLGGVLTQVLSARHPERVRSMVLAATACRVQDWRRELFEEWCELVADRGVRAFAAENLRWIAAARHLRWIAPVAPALAPLVARAPAHGIIGQIRAIASITEQLHEELHTVTLPTLVIVGSQDILTPVADSEEIVHRLPHARFNVVAGAAHSLVVTDAGVFNRAVADFHREVVAASRV